MSATSCSALHLQFQRFLCNTHTWIALNSRWWLYLPTLEHHMHVWSVGVSVFLHASYMKINLIPCESFTWHFLTVSLCALAPLWRVYAVAMPNAWLFLRPNYFHYHFFHSGCSYVRVWLFHLDGTHAHLYKQNFVAQTEYGSSLSTIRQYCLDFHVRVVRVFAFHCCSRTYYHFSGSTLAPVYM